MARLRSVVLFSGFLASLLAGAALAYPLDGYESTGIARLQYQRWVQEGKIDGKKRPPGELLPLDKVDLRLLQRPDFTLPPADPTVTAEIKRLLGQHADRYGIVLLDLSDLDHPRYAEWNGQQQQQPGSVGKLLVALAIFQALADLYPADLAARNRVLREAMIVADEFSVYDGHTMPYFDPATMSYVRHPIQQGDTASMWTYLDWMMSPSSNSAAGMLQKHLILLVHYGKDYPVSREEELRFFRETSRQQLTDLFVGAMESPVARNGLSLEELRQGSFFTNGGKQRVGGTGSHATPRALLEYLLKMEKGQLVDEWSSREIKRLMYVTERRIRYASAGALQPAAVYFKSGSLFGCVPEAGFTCKKYQGNERNYMNSVAIVESPAGENRLYYMVTVLSNVLRKNSANDHRDLARAIHERIIADHPSAAEAGASYGEGFIGYEQEQSENRLRFDTQEALLDLGFDIGEIDGAIGPKTQAAIREFQKSQGIEADGTPSAELVELMRKVAIEKGLSRPREASAE